MLNTAQFFRAAMLLTILGLCGCGALCFGGNEVEGYQREDVCSGTVTAPPALNLDTAPFNVCEGPLPSNCLLTEDCLRSPSTCAKTCLEIQVVATTYALAGATVDIGVQGPFSGEQTLPPDDPSLTIDARLFGSGAFTPGTLLTVTGGAITLLMRPNDVTATVSLDLTSPAGEVIRLKDIHLHQSGQDVTMCATQN